MRRGARGSRREGAAGWGHPAYKGRGVAVVEPEARRYTAEDEDGKGGVPPVPFAGLAAKCPGRGRPDFGCAASGGMKMDFGKGTGKLLPGNYSGGESRLWEY